MVDGETPQTGLFPILVGEQLRIAREAAKLDLNDISTKTRIPLRHLTAIENSDYGELPSQTYALGFAKSYARAIGLDEVTLGNELRTELGRSHPGARDADVYEPADPSRVPPRLLAWTAALLALVIVIGYGIWRGGYFDAADTVASAPVAPRPEASVPATSVVKPAAAAGPGQVVLTATTPVWLRITDGSKTALFQKEMSAGDSYQLPLTATDPKILTGRPDALKVTIDGREVAPLGGPKTTVRNLGISAAALNARTPVASQPPAAGSAPVAATPPAVSRQPKL